MMLLLGSEMQNYILKRIKRHAGTMNEDTVYMAECELMRSISRTLL